MPKDYQKVVRFMTVLEKTRHIRSRVRELLSSGEVSFFIGYEAGHDTLHIAPAFVYEEDEAETLVWNQLCINNLASYLKRYRKEKGKIGLLIKGCDSRSIIELLKLHQIQREQIYLIGVPCDGILDPKKVASVCPPETITDLYEEEGRIIIERGEQGREAALDIDKDALLFEKCRTCAHPNPLISDELVGEPVPVRPAAAGNHKFEDVEGLEKLTPGDRLEFWNEHLSKCIRCYACKNVCPMCFCTECLWEKRDPQWVTKHHNPDDLFTFHMIRAYHMVGRCTGCLECERVCPVDIPLSALFKKIEKDTLELFDYQPGVEIDVVPPLNTYDESDQVHEELLR